MKVEKNSPAATPIKADGQAITVVGDNSQPAFSPDGQKIIFVSAYRSRHKAGQIYEMELKSRKERRITFQVSAVRDPQYGPHGDVVLYASSNDELKEHPPILSSGSKPDEFDGPVEFREPDDLYLHHLQGLSMERLTKREGYDGQAHFISPHEIVFTRRSGKTLSLMEMALHGTARPWHGAGDRPAQLVPSHDGRKFAWIEYAPDFKTTDLKLREGRSSAHSILNDIHAMKKDPVWTPDGSMIVFSMNHPKADEFEIYAVKTDGSCLTALTKENVKAEQPAVSPSGDAFAFVSTQTGGQQIYLKAFPKELNCGLPPAEYSAPVP